MLFTIWMRIFLGFLDTNGRTAATCGSHVLALGAACVGKHSEQKLLQETSHIARLITGAHILNQRVLEHAIGSDVFRSANRKPNGR